MRKVSNSKLGFTALLPLLAFVFIFLGSGIYLDNFYALPSPIAVIAGLLLAFIMFKGSNEDKVTTFLKGCGEEKIITMCLIFLLAGAFTVISTATGSVEAIVNLGLRYISVQYLYAGIFLLAAFLSFSTGTFVGTIVALGALVAGFAERTEASVAILSASLLGGSMFGDNLSFISDTTIAATQSLGCHMKDKFRQNIKVAIPAAGLTIGILLFQGSFLSDNSLSLPEGLNYIRVIPYFFVITLALLGVNVFTVLLGGIFAAGLIGIIHGDFNLLEFANLGYKGFTNMTELFLLSMFTGGLAAMVTKAGGLDYLSGFITRRINPRSAYLGIGGLAGLTNLALANNTVAIVIIGPIANGIKDEMKLDKAKAASVLDIFACVVQAIIPYGAQVLLLSSYSAGKLRYVDLMFSAWYVWLLLAATVIYFLLRPSKVVTKINKRKVLKLSFWRKSA